MEELFDATDFTVVVKQRGALAKPWRWEIYRAGRSTPVKKSEGFYATMAEATRAGKAALAQLTSEAA
jgi:hypothetical protein